MNRTSLSWIPIVVLLMFSAPDSAFAGSGKTRCPAVVGDLTSGKMIVSKGRFECFKTGHAAAQAGFVLEGTPGAGAPPTAQAAELVFQGTTSQNTTPFALTRRPSAIAYVHNSSRYFSIVLRNAETGNWEELLASSIGPISAATHIYEVGNFYLDITAHGPYVVKVVP